MGLLSFQNIQISIYSLKFPIHHFYDVFEVKELFLSNRTNLKSQIAFQNSLELHFLCYFIINFQVTHYWFIQKSWNFLFSYHFLGDKYNSEPNQNADFRSSSLIIDLNLVFLSRNYTNSFVYQAEFSNGKQKKPRKFQFNFGFSFYSKNQ